VSSPRGAALRRPSLWSGALRRGLPPSARVPCGAAGGCRWGTPGAYPHGRRCTKGRWFSYPPFWAIALVGRTWLGNWLRSTDVSGGPVRPAGPPGQEEGGTGRGNKVSWSIGKSNGLFHRPRPPTPCHSAPAGARA
jgi:hypothetical protein